MTIWTKLHNERQERDSIVESVKTLRKHLEDAVREKLTSRTQKLIASSRTPVENVLQRSQERRIRRLEEYEAQHKPPFRPTILATSRRLAAERLDAHRPLHERLYLTGRKSSRVCVSNIERADKTFSSRSVNGGSFLKRLKAYEDASHHKMEIRKRHETNNLSFHPIIGAKSENMAISSRLEQDIIERLAVSDPQKRENDAIRRDMLAEPECSFLPQINSLSNSIACMRNHRGNIPVHDRLFQLQEKTPREKAIPDGCDRPPSSATKQCTTMKARNPYKYVSPNYNLRNPTVTLAVIDRARRERDQKRIRRIKERERSELAECTFQPNIHKIRPESARPILVSGLERFLETQAKARRASLQGKVRGLREYDDSNHDGAITVPCPFPFSSDRLVN